MDSKRQIVLCFFGALMLSSCLLIDVPNQDFYKDELADYDMKRLPIIKPYQLVGDYGSWTFYPNNELPKQPGIYPMTIDSLNYSNGKIFFYSESPDHGWIIFNIESGKAKIFGNYEHFIQYSDSNKLSRTFFNADSVRNWWLKTEKLPWESELTK